MSEIKHISEILPGVMKDILKILESQEHAANTGGEQASTIPVKASGSRSGRLYPKRR